MRRLAAASLAALGALAVVLVWLAGVQAAAKDVLITDQDNGRAYTVRVGQKITVNLRHPGSGGYSFLTPQYDQALLEKVGENRLPATEPRRMGDFGRMVYEFQALKAGSTTLIVPIKRPWEKDSQTYLKINILVRH
jgi:predicted secreted protein